jgi:hypothetical protein
MRNGGVLLLTIKMASDTPNVAVHTPADWFTVTQDLSTEDIK